MPPKVRLRFITRWLRGFCGASSTCLTDMNRHIVIVLALALLVPLSGMAHAESFGNGTILTPSSASGGTGTVADLQTDNNVRYRVAKGGNMSAGGFSTNINPIQSVHLFAQYTVDEGYSGSNALKVNNSNAIFLLVTDGFHCLYWLYLIK